MFTYFKILQVFVLSVMFQKDELNFKSKSFKPARLLLLTVLMGNVLFTAYLVKKLYRVHTVIVEICPQVYDADMSITLKEKRLPTVK